VPTCTALTRCLTCDSVNLEEVLNLGYQALANDFSVSKTPDQQFPLALNYCHDCSHLQLTHSVERARLFDDYQYLSGTSATLIQDFDNFAKELHLEFGTSKILDVACNDGSQLDSFKKLGWKTFGIDPAKNLFELTKNRHAVVCDYLKPKHAGTFQTDITLAQNVMAHTPNPQEMLKTIGLISPKAFTQTSQAEMIQKNQFDTVYHEHISFFTERSFFELSKKVEFPLVSIEKRSIHGKSFLFRNDHSGNWVHKPEKLQYKKVLDFAQNSKSIRKKLDQELNSLSRKGLKLVGYGAAAKGMTVLNSIEESLDLIIDDSPLKQNKFTPTKKIPIFAPSVLSDLNEEFVLVLLAWNFKDEVLRKVMKEINRPFKVLEYFPEVIVYDYTN
jgi:2-polyprenyl-3-methyl-5-hydroxy-6-metoxy-1,4-benzoquinol methylase